SCSFHFFASDYGCREDDAQAIHKDDVSLPIRVVMYSRFAPYIIDACGNTCSRSDADCDSGSIGYVAGSILCAVSVYESLPGAATVEDGGKDRAALLRAGVRPGGLQEL